MATGYKVSFNEQVEVKAHRPTSFRKCEKLELEVQNAQPFREAHHR
jgi:hypothetical protein